MSKESIQLIQFAKWPVKGRVKTRLAKSIGEEAALAAHKQLLDYVLSGLIGADIGDTALWFDHIPAAIAEKTYADISANADFQIQLQTQGDLGKKMQHALSAYLPDKDKVLLVGSDCPSICSEYLQSAIDALDQTCMVFGPAEDGGYVLIGASRGIGNHVPDIVFEEVAWGTRQVMKKTQQNLKAADISFSLLDMAWDVDEIEDWQRFLAIKKERSMLMSALDIIF